MTFEERVKRDRRVACLVALWYFFGLTAMGGVLYYVVLFVALKMELTTALVNVALSGVFMVFAFLAGWNAQRSFKSTVDMMVRDMGPIERAVMVAAIEQDKENLTSTMNELAEITAQKILKVPAKRLQA